MTIDQIQIRPAQPADLTAVLRLMSENDLTGEGIEAFFSDAYAIAEHEGTIVGCGGIEVYDQHGLLRSVAVDGDWKSRGLGAALVADRLAWAADQSLDCVYLLTLTAPHFFRKQGFRTITRGDVPEVVRQSEEFTQLCPETAEVMAYEIDQLK